MKAGKLRGRIGVRRRGPAKVGEVRVWSGGAKVRKASGGKWESVKEKAKAVVAGEAKKGRASAKRKATGTSKKQGRDNEPTIGGSERGHFDAKAYDKFKKKWTKDGSKFREEDVVRYIGHSIDPDQRRNVVGHGLVHEALDYSLATGRMSTDRSERLRSMNGKQIGEMLYHAIPRKGEDASISAAKDRIYQWIDERGGK